MLWFKSESLEDFLNNTLYFLLVLICTLSILLAWKFHVDWYWIALGVLPVFTIGLWFIALIKQRVLRTFTRACLYAEAIAKGEFEQFTKASFSEGKVSELYQHLALLSNNLQKKSSSTQAPELLHLLNALPTPVILLNQAAEITYANQALYEYAQCQPTDNDAHVISKLNLIKRKVNEQDRNMEWQLASEHLHMQLLSSQLACNNLDEEKHEADNSSLLIFIDLSSSQEGIKDQARAQLIERIYTLGMNTLTPIVSLVEHMKNENQASANTSPNFVASCHAIKSSCETFTRGIARYMGFVSNTQLNQRLVPLGELLAPHQTQYSELTVKNTRDLENIWCDVEQIQPVIFDLIQNAYEANAKNVSVNLTKHEQYAVLEVIDDGDGFNCITQDLTPFSTTKADAEHEGLSLYFAKSIIERHAGVFECHNNAQQGATVMMLLPFANV